MKEDPIFKSRFNIATPIRYLPDVVVDPKCEKEYQKEWVKFQKTLEPSPPTRRQKQFDAVLRNIHMHQDDFFYTFNITIQFIDREIGYGVFARNSIAPYTVLNSYAGILCPDSSIPSENDSTFMFTDFKKFSIDAAKAGNWCRFMNHSPEKDKNTNVIAWEHYSQWGPRILFTAGKKGISKGCQLLYSYGDSYWDEGEFASF